jgi:GNAT superfamily N-acetyltransferase
VDPDRDPGVPTPKPPDVVVADPGDLPGLCDSLGDAFRTDPVMSWILKDEDSRLARLARLFSVQLRGHYLPLGTVWTTPDRAGASLWAPPGHAIVPTTTILKYLPDVLRALGRHTLRALRSLNYIEGLHPKEPHWYLGVLGTRTAAQGRGIGSALLTPVLDRCDEEGIPAFLESSKESNIAFYRRHGFEVTGEIPLPLGGPSVWPMWRDPRPR